MGESRPAAAPKEKKFARGTSWHKRRTDESLATMPLGGHEARQLLDAACELDDMLGACYKHAMANLQVKNVPEPLHAKIRRLAKREGRTVRDYVLDAVRREIARTEFQQRLRGRERVELGRLAAASVEEVRAERDDERSA